MSTPLYNKLIAYSSSKLSFHMPGHKFGSIADISKLNLSLLDNTEVMNMDNLYEANGIIREAMQLMANFYGAKETLFLTNGSTAGILASILSLCKDGEKIILARNCHHSVWNALVLSGAVPVYVNPEYLQEDNLLGEITAENIRQALELHTDAKGVIIVSPTYEGIISDIKAIAEVVHEYGKVFIVDEAHGAHFILGECFPKSSIQLGADLVINSMHKTLPALTQSALLHIGSDRINYGSILSALRMIQTSSPSYMMMGLMDYIREYISENKKAIKEDYINHLTNTRENLKKMKYLMLIEKTIKRYDISKIVISTQYTPISGYKLAELLNDEYNIMVEAALSTYVILMTTMADNKATLSKLENALMSIDSTLEKALCERNTDYFFNYKITQGISPREVYYAEKEWMILDKCEGKVLAHSIMLYPPGIPIICIGETLDEENMKLIYVLKEKLQGIQLIEEKIMLQVVK